MPNCLKYDSEGFSPKDIPTSCKLCLDDHIAVEDIVIIKSCECGFCIQIELLSKPDTYEKYKRLKFEQEVAIDPRRTFCPEVSCSAVCHVCTNSYLYSSVAPQAVQCATCHLRFCYTCKAEWKHNHKCSEYTRTFGSEFQNLQNRTGFSFGGHNASIKRCPVCNILIEKDRGCAQMICKHCSHVFCWYCLKLLDNDFMLRHYDSGPCRNLLGHSRAQVFRHRIGVIGLFTALSLLLLVASPVLVLAAPVILCCKCKECCQQVINQAQQHRGSVDVQLRSDKVLTENVLASNHDVELDDVLVCESSGTFPSVSNENAGNLTDETSDMKKVLETTT
uniref:RBR-type E3 ubiquitin transferase n=1 Tax=Ciona savignyi TaxID=51511 RepID=H2ZR47_CIOSA